MLMATNEKNEAFEGWAIVELFGHQKEIGYVSTRYFGTACMFQVDVPELPEREAVLLKPQYHSVDGGMEYLPVGTKIKKSLSPGRSRFIGPGAIYALNPCSEEIAREAIESMNPREIIVLEKPKQQVIDVHFPELGEGQDGPEPDDEP